MKQIILILLIMLLCLYMLPQASGEADSSGMSLLAINVRKADALLLRSGNSAYLIDTGSKDSFEQMYTVLKEAGISSLDGVILTHTDSDHVGGLKQLVKSDIEIAQVYSSVYYNKKDEGKHPAVKALKNTGKEVVFLSAGDQLQMGDALLTVLGPLEKNDNAENNNSLVILAACSSGSMLLTGDMEFPEEKSLLAAEAIPQVDVLKVGNHGEDDATSNALIAAARPKLAVISTNTQDEPDTPSPRVMRLLASWKIPVLVTQDTQKGVLVTLKDGIIETEMR